MTPTMPNTSTIIRPPMALSGRQNWKKSKPPAMAGKSTSTPTRANAAEHECSPTRPDAPQSRNRVCANSETETPVGGEAGAARSRRRCAARVWHCRRVCVRSNCARAGKKKKKTQLLLLLPQCSTLRACPHPPHIAEMRCVPRWRGPGPFGALSCCWWSVRSRRCRRLCNARAWCNRSPRPSRCNN